VVRRPNVVVSGDGSGSRTMTWCKCWQPWCCHMVHASSFTIHSNTQIAQSLTTVPY